MAETYTKRGRAVLQEYGSNPEAWGAELNVGALQRGDDMWGTTGVVVNGDVTLTVANKIADQARGFVLILSGTGGFIVTAPALDKPYLVVNNCGADVTIRPGIMGTGATARAGTQVLIYMNAAGSTAFAVDMPLNMFKPPIAALALNGQKITGLGAGSPASTDASQMAQVEALIASASNISLPAKLGHSLQALRVTFDETNIEWAAVTQTAIFPLVNVAVNTAMVVNTLYWVTTTSGSINMTMPAAPANGDTIGVIREGANTAVVLRNGNNIALLAEDHTIDVNLLLVVFKFKTGSGWRIISVTGVA